MLLLYKLESRAWHPRYFWGLARNWGGSISQIGKVLNRDQSKRYRIKIFILNKCRPCTHDGKGSSEGKKVQQILTWTFAIGMSIEFKFAKSKTIHEANIEGRLYTGRKICQNGQNRLCVSTAISKMASWIFLLFGNLNFVDIPITNFQVRICWTFFPSELPFPPWVNKSCQLFHSHLEKQIQNFKY